MDMINELTALEDWQEVWERSMHSPILIYKHSTSCMISARALKQVKSYIANDEDTLDCYMVKVIESRSVSNEIAKDTNVPHKSPQIFLIDKQQIIWNASHWKITNQQIRDTVRQFFS